MAQGEDRIGLLATVGVLLLALLTVCVVWFTRADATQETRGAGGTTEEPTGPPSEPAPQLAEVWQAPDAAGGLAGEDAATRLWPGDAVVTRVSAAGVTGYGTLDGQPVWQGEVPDGAERPCAASASTNTDGLGAVLFLVAADAPDAEDAEEPGPDEDADASDADRATAGACAVLGVYDTRSGALLWSYELPDPEEDTDQTGGRTGAGIVAEDAAGPDESGAANPDLFVPVVTVGERAVTVTLDAAGSVAGFHRFQAESGEELPLPEPPNDGWCAAAEPLAVRHAGARVAMLSECPAQTPGEAASRALSVYAADTGELQWTHLSDDPDFGFTGILAGNPVLLYQGEDENRELVAYSETGEEMWRRTVGVAGERAGLLPEESVVVGDVLVSRYEPDGSTTGYAVAGYDLATRERMWARLLPAGSRLLGVDAAGVPLLSREDGDRTELFRLDAGTGTESQVGTVGSLDPSLVAVDDHQLYVLSEAGDPDDPLLRLRAFER